MGKLAPNKPVLVYHSFIEKSKERRGKQMIEGRDKQIEVMIHLLPMMSDQGVKRAFSLFWNIYIREGKKAAPSFRFNTENPISRKRISLRIEVTTMANLLGLPLSDYEAIEDNPYTIPESIDCSKIIKALEILGVSIDEL